MKKIFILFSFLISAFAAQSQSVLFQDDFESVSLNWTLNGGNGDNQWIINNVYAGFPPLIPDTQDQPSGINNYPNSFYMHIVNQTACTNQGICNASFNSSSTSLQYTTMTNDISTIGYTGVSISMYFLVAGGLTTYGAVEYSTNGGTGWTQIGNNLNSTPGWTLWTQTDATWDNISGLRFRFKWSNGSGIDPAFSVDQINITGVGGGGGQSITTGTIQPLTYCAGDAIDVPFTITGTFNSGNVFTAQLSDATGSFNSPDAIGTLSGVNSGTINGLTSISTPSGSLYRVRVVSLNPPVNGSDNGSDIRIDQAPSVTLPAFNPNTFCEDDPAVTLSGGTPAGGTYSGNGVSGTSFDPVVAGVGTHTITYTYTDGISGCSGTAQQPLYVVICGAVNPLDAGNYFAAYPNPSDGEVTFEYSLNENFSDATIQITNLFGQVVQTLMIENQNGNVSLDKNLSSGIYFCSLKLNGNFVAMRRLVVY